MRPGAGADIIIKGGAEIITGTKVEPEPKVNNFGSAALKKIPATSHRKPLPSWLRDQAAPLSNQQQSLHQNLKHTRSLKSDKKKTICIRDIKFCFYCGTGIN